MSSTTSTPTTTSHARAQSLINTATSTSSNASVFTFPAPTSAPAPSNANAPNAAETGGYTYPVTSEGYDLYEEIGSGAFSTVYRGAVKETGEEVAIKVIDLDAFNTSWDEIRREIMIMSLVSHPNVVKIKTSFVDAQDLWIVMALLSAGSCASVMKIWSEQGLKGMKDEALVATILKEVLQALVYFHKDGLIHRDVKAGNILISATGEVQLADFGVAGTLLENGDRKKGRQTFTGTPCWMAPEVMEMDPQKGYDEKADIWSVGITAMELGYGYAPYAKYQPMKVMLLTLQEEPPTCAIYNDHSYEFSKHYHSLIAKCLHKDPKKRPTAKKLLEHKFFRSAKDSSYIIEQIVKKLPIREKLNNKIEIGSKKLAAKSSNQAKSPRQGGGVRIGSWVFDEDDIIDLKNETDMPPHIGRKGSRIEEGDGYDTNDEEIYDQQDGDAAGDQQAVEVDRLSDFLSNASTPGLSPALPSTSPTSKPPARSSGTNNAQLPPLPPSQNQSQTPTITGRSSGPLSNVLNAGTPTLGSVQTKRQFLVSEEIVEKSPAPPSMDPLDLSVSNATPSASTPSASSLYREQASTATLDLNLDANATPLSVSDIYRSIANADFLGTPTHLLTRPQSDAFGTRPQNRGAGDQAIRSHNSSPINLPVSQPAPIQVDKDAKSISPTIKPSVNTGFSQLELNLISPSPLSNTSSATPQLSVNVASPQLSTTAAASDTPNQSSEHVQKGRFKVVSQTQDANSSS